MKSAPDNFSIRLATEHDLNYVVALQRDHINELGFIHRTALLDKIARRHILIVYENDAPAGYLNANHKPDHHVHLLQVAITEELWRNGHGAAALDYLANTAQQRGALFITCRTAQGLPANEFWPALGFKPHGSIQGPRRRLNRWSKRLSNIIIPGARLKFPYLRPKHARPLPTPTQT